MCLVSQSCLTICDPMDCNPPGSSVHGDSPGKNTGADCHAVLQGILQTRGLNPGLLHCRRFFFFFFNHLSHQESPEVSTVCHKTYPFLLLPSVPGSTACQPTHPTTWKTIFCGDHVYTFWAWTSWIYILTLAFISCLTLGNLTTVASISSFMKWITALIFCGSNALICLNILEWCSPHTLPLLLHFLFQNVGNHISRSFP